MRVCVCVSSVYHHLHPFRIRLVLCFRHISLSTRIRGGACDIAFFVLPFINVSTITAAQSWSNERKRDRDGANLMKNSLDSKTNNWKHRLQMIESIKKGSEKTKWSINWYCYQRKNRHFAFVRKSFISVRLCFTFSFSFISVVVVFLFDFTIYSYRWLLLLLLSPNLVFTAFFVKRALSPRFFFTFSISVASKKYTYAQARAHTHIPNPIDSISAT